MKGNFLTGKNLRDPILTFDELLQCEYKRYLTVFNEAERSVWISWLDSIKIGLAKIRFKVIGTPSGRHGQQSFPLGPSIANHSISLSCWKSPFRH